MGSGYQPADVEFLRRVARALAKDDQVAQRLRNTIQAATQGNAR